MHLVPLIVPSGAHRRRRTGRLTRKTCLRFAVCGGDSSRYFSRFQVAHSGISGYLVLFGRVSGYVYTSFSGLTPFLTITRAFIKSVPPVWRLESLTIGPIERDEDSEFWDAALKDFPRFPHLTKFRLIYHYSMPDSSDIFRRTDLPDRDEHCEPTVSHSCSPYNVSLDPFQLHHQTRYFPAFGGCGRPSNVYVATHGSWASGPSVPRPKNRAWWEADALGG